MWFSKKGHFSELFPLKPSFFKLSRTEIAEIRMTPFTIVKHLDVINDEEVRNQWTYAGNSNLRDCKVATTGRIAEVDLAPVLKSR